MFSDAVAALVGIVVFSLVVSALYEVVAALLARREDRAKAKRERKVDSEE
jgi:hypothetical protein